MHDLRRPAHQVTSGGKALGLALLASCRRVRVPAWFSIPTDARRRHAAGHDSLDGELGAQIVELWRDQLGGGPVAVRSSADGEDGAAQSQAGRYRSVLDVRTAEGLLEAVELVWASAPPDVEMGVVVQQFVEAELSGVAATRDLATGQRRLVVSYAHCRGDALVGGTVEARMWRADPDGLVAIGDVAGWRDHHLRELAAAGREIELQIGRACEFEWCITDGRLHVVQARPLVGDEAQPIAVWSDEPIHEQLPGAVAPLSFDLVSQQVGGCTGELLRSLGVPAPLVMRSPLERINGRAYFCESHWFEATAAAASVGIGCRTLRAALGLPPDAARIISRRHRVRARLQVARTWMSVLRIACAPGRASSRLHRRITSARTSAELITALHRSQRAMVATDIAAALAARWGDGGVGAAATMPTQPQAHRLSEGLKLESGTIGRHARSARPATATRRTQCHGSVRQRRAARIAVERERFGWLRAEAFAHLRSTALASAKRAVARGVLEHLDDVFLLRVDELLQLDELRELDGTLDGRRAAYAQEQMLAPLPARWAGAVPARGCIEPSQVQAVSHGAAARAIGCCAGQATAPVVHVRSIEDIERAADSIAVCAWLTPDVAALLERAAGIVVERGSALSHGVLVARELGIPTIVGAGDALLGLVDGDVISVDGTSGIIART
jgi:phosphohistidine swiveling domain-containing protein